MYCVTREFFNNNGDFLARDVIMCPGYDAEALREYLAGLKVPKFCGYAPAYVYALPESGSPIVYEYGGK